MPWIRPLTLSLVLVSVPALSHAGDLTTRDVVELARSGLGDEVLVALVEVDGGPFDLSPADLLDLKSEGLSDRVLIALVRVGRHAVPDSVAFDDGLPDFDQPFPHSWRFTDQPYLVETVAVPYPVYVPVYQHRTFSGRRGGRGPDHVKKRGGRWTDHEITPLPSTRRVPGPVTVDSIRYAPPGFHPGTIRSRPSPSASAPPAPSPGIARSTASADRPPPGVARSQRPSSR